MAAAIELLKYVAISVTDLITDELPLSEGVTAMQRAAKKGVLKVLLRMHS